MSARRLLLLLFLLSGAFGIQYEILWLRLITQVAGSTIQGVAAVVTAFLLGLALGSRLLGPRADRVARPLRLYALLEILIGLVHLAVFFLFRFADQLYGALYRFLPGAAVTWVVFALALLVVTLPATLIGGTLPVMHRHFVRTEQAVRTDPAHLYALNTFGAALGALSLSLLLIPRVGYAASFWVAAIGSILVGVAVLLLATREQEDLPVAPVGGADAEARIGAPGSLVSRAPLLVAYGLSGFAALGFEVLSTRLLLFLFRGSLVSFGVVLFLLTSGLALGSYLARFLIRSRFSRPVLFGALQFGAGLLLLGSLFLIQVFSIGPEFLLLLFVLSALLGAAYPIVVELDHRDLRSFGAAVGRVYAANTFGSILGALACGFLLIPLLGSKHTLVLLGSIHLLLASVFLLPRLRWPGSLGVAAAGLALLAGALNAPADILWKRWFEPRRILHVQENETEVLTVTEGVRGERTLFGGPFISGSTARRTVQILQAHVAMLAHPEPRRVLEIGYGVGEILRNVLLHEPESVDLVELDREMLSVADAWFERINRGASADPRVNTHIMDGRLFLARSNESFDVIMSDSWFAQSESSFRLYTLEHFRAGREHLSESGLMIVWVPRNMGDERASTLLETFVEVFPETLVWVRQQTLFLIGYRFRPHFDLERLGQRFETLGRSALEPYGYPDLFQLLAGFRLGPERLRRFRETGEGRLHRDLSPRLDFIPKGLTGTDSRLGRALAEGSPEVLWPFVSEEESTRFGRRFSGLAAADRLVMRAAATEPVPPDLLEQALELFPGHVEASLLLSQLLVRRGLDRFDQDRERAVSDLERAIELMPSRAAALRLLFDHHRQRDNPGQALEYRRRYLELLPYDPRLAEDRDGTSSNG